MDKGFGSARAVCQRRALRLGRQLLVQPQEVAGPGALISMAHRERQDGAQPCFPLSLVRHVCFPPAFPAPLPRHYLCQFTRPVHTGSLPCS